MFSTIKSGTIYGINCFIIDIEVDVSQGLPCFIMVGNLAGEVKESSERVRIALKNSNITIPPMHISVNLSPANIYKGGTMFDVPIAIGLLSAMKKINVQNIDNTFVVGELGLNGEVKRISGVMPLIWEAKKAGISQCIVPDENLSEAMLVEGIDILGIRHIKDAIDFLNLSISNQHDICVKNREKFKKTITEIDYDSDFNEVYGQENLKKGAMLSAAGKHHMLIVGPPGSGKTMIAKRMAGILPPLTKEEMMDITAIYSIAGKLNTNEPVITKRPFIAPHHTTTEKAISGGGVIPRPGALSLAHKGILFLDEFPEFNRSAIEMLREPLEEKCIHITRTKASFVYPSDIMLVAAMNPCPCGYYPDNNRCSCSIEKVRKYVGRISGPIIDRIDICLTANKVQLDRINKDNNGLSSAQMRSRVIMAREKQLERYKGLNITCNSELEPKHIAEYCRLPKNLENRFVSLCEKLDISARTYHRLLKIARTIADVDDKRDVDEKSIYEAICYKAQINNF